MVHEPVVTRANVWHFHRAFAVVSNAKQAPVCIRDEVWRLYVDSVADIDVLIEFHNVVLLRVTGVQVSFELKNLHVSACVSLNRHVKVVVEIVENRCDVVGWPQVWSKGPPYVGICLDENHVDVEHVPAPAQSKPHADWHFNNVGH